MRWLAKPLSGYNLLRGFESPSLRGAAQTFVRRWCVRASGALLLMLGVLGCVERKLLLRSDPPGAEIYLDGVREGEIPPELPLEIGFEHYGVRLVEARLEGYQPLRRSLVLEPPWYQRFPLGFFSEVLWPGTLEDVHRVPPLQLKARQAPRGADEVVESAKRFADQEGQRP